VNKREGEEEEEERRRRKRRAPGGPGDLVGRSRPTRFYAMLRKLEDDDARAALMSRRVGEFDRGRPAA